MGLFFYRRHTPPYLIKKWNDEFKRKLFFSHGQSNSCGVAIGFIGKTGFEVSNKKQDDSGRILILDVKVGDNNFLLINLSNANGHLEISASASRHQHRHSKKKFFLAKFIFLPFEVFYEENIYGEVIFKYPCTPSREFQSLFRAVIL